MLDMNVHRFNGVKIDLEKCTPVELDHLEAYALARRDMAIGELAILHPQPSNVVPIRNLFEHDYPPDYGGAS